MVTSISQSTQDTIARVEGFMRQFNVGQLADTPFDVTANVVDKDNEPVGGDPNHTERYLEWYKFTDVRYNSKHMDVLYHGKSAGTQGWSQQDLNMEQMLAMNVGLTLEEELRKLAKTDSILCFMTTEKSPENMHESAFIALHHDRLIVGSWGICYEEENRHFKTGVRIGTVGLQDSRDLAEDTDAYEILSNVEGRKGWIAIVGVPDGVVMETGDAAGTYSWDSVYQALQADLTSGTPPRG